MATKELFLEKVKTKLETWKADVDRLQANAERIDRQEMGPYSAVIKEIIAKIQKIEKQFTDNGDSSTRNWLRLKQHIEESGKEIEADVKRVKRDFSL